MCNCLKETEEQLREKLESGLANMKPKKDATLRFLHPKNVALSLRDGKQRLQIPYEATWEMSPDRSGKFKDTIIYIVASHCPFCGQPFDSASEVDGGRNIKKFKFRYHMNGADHEETIEAENVAAAGLKLGRLHAERFRSGVPKDFRIDCESCEEIAS